eukprot:748438-Hanusia_phi.AAC.3
MAELENNESPPCSAAKKVLSKSSRRSALASVLGKLLMKTDVELQHADTDILLCCSQCPSGAPSLSRVFRKLSRC